MSLIIRRIALLLTLILYSTATAQESTDKIADDSARVVSDSLYEESRIDKVDEYLSKKEPINFYNFSDTVNQRTFHAYNDFSGEHWRSLGHDASDYLKYNPSNFSVIYQNTPVRSLVSPYSLPGDRVNIIFNNRQLKPLEHLPEPDGKIDFNDIPTTFTGHIYNIEGPLGLALGGDNLTSSMILVPPDPDTTRAESRMDVNVGSFGYAYTKGMFTHRNAQGRSIKMGAGYRKAVGADIYRDDNAYHQWAELILPVGNRVRLNFSGRLYRRDGTIPLRPRTSSANFDRFRRDKDFAADLDWAHSSRQKTSFEFRHQKLESNIESNFSLYYHNIDFFDNTVILSHERKFGKVDTRIRAAVSQEKYKDNQYSSKRHHGYADMLSSVGDSSNSILTYIKAEKAGGYKVVPSAALAYLKYSSLFRFSASFGYSTKIPRQYELDLVPRLDNVYTGGGGIDYYEAGNPFLKAEKQAMGNVMMSLGKAGSDFSLSFTGGQIFDGIDWQRFDTLDLELTGIRPENNDIDFYNVTAGQKLHWKDNIIWSGSGSYRYVKQGDNDDLPYSPDYQFFSSLQLYYYIQKLELHLYAYTEGMYSGIYYGYNGKEYGQDFIMNVKLSFRIKKFQFFYIFQNMPSINYLSREEFFIPGRYNWYGITWEFLD